MKTPESQLEAMRRYRIKRAKRMLVLDMILDLANFESEEPFTLWIRNDEIFPDPKKLSLHQRFVLGLPAKPKPADYNIYVVTVKKKKEIHGRGKSDGLAKVKSMNKA